jgi:hypothetical protein
VENCSSTNGLTTTITIDNYVRTFGRIWILSFNICRCQIKLILIMKENHL